MKARLKIDLLLICHNSHGALLEILRNSDLDSVNKAHVVNEVLYNLFAVDTAIFNEEIQTLDEFVEYFERFEQRLETKISES